MGELKRKKPRLAPGLLCFFEQAMCWRYAGFLDTPAYFGIGIGPMSFGTL
jgi:hypothetical protein